MTLKQLFAPADMTTGKPWEKIVIFTIPMLLGNIAQQLYSTVDSIVVGKYVGDNALAAVGSAAPIYNLLLILFMGVSVGASVVVSQYFGAKKREELSKAIGNSITLTAIVSLIIMVMGAIIIRPLLNMLSTPDSIIDWCYDYLMILVMGIAGTAYYNILCGVLRGLGDSVSALVYLLVATVINIVLDIWFVASLDMGVAGVALATIIAQFVTNSFGEMVIAANVIIMRVDGFAMMPNFSFGTAMTTFAGQNVGAGKYDRVAKGTKQGTIIALATSAVITGVIVLFGKYLMGIFTDTADLVTLSSNMMKILAVGYIAMAVTQCLSGVMRGAGDTTTPMWISIVTTVIIRVPLAYGIAYLTRTPEAPNGSYLCLWISLLTSWVLGAVITFVCYLRGRWRSKGVGADKKALD